jgi:hypothetical protein
MKYPLKDKTSVAAQDMKMKRETDRERNIVI